MHDQSEDGITKVYLKQTESAGVPLSCEADIPATGQSLTLKWFKTDTGKK